MDKHFNIHIYGVVQGVFFRLSAGEKARELGIKGFALNETDGSVYIEAEGEEVELKKIIAWCHQGPELARVQKVEVEEGEFKGFQTFSMR